MRVSRRLVSRGLDSLLRRTGTVASSSLLGTYSVDSGLQWTSLSM